MTTLDDGGAGRDPAPESDLADATASLAFEGPAAFAQALSALLDEAAARGARRLCWCDADFSAWPLGRADWIARLTRWARAGGQELVVVAADYRAIERLHPRFVEWRRDWSHRVQCLVPDESHTAGLPTLWVDTIDQALRVFDRDRWRGRAGGERIDRQRAREDFDAISQRASAGFSATTLGL
jgi:hypothetical protein